MRIGGFTSVCLLPFEDVNKYLEAFSAHARQEMFTCESCEWPRVNSRFGHSRRWIGGGRSCIIRFLPFSRNRFRRVGISNVFYINNTSRQLHYITLTVIECNLDGNWRRAIALAVAILSALGCRSAKSMSNIISVWGQGDIAVFGVVIWWLQDR